MVRGGDDAWSVSDGTTVALLRRDGGSLSVLRRPDAARATQAGQPRGAQPSIWVVDADDNKWLPRPDLLASGGDAREFVVEMEHDRTATLRFGDQAHGRRPDAGTQFKATYRVGNGSRGNIGADSLAHLVSTDLSLVSVENRAPADGGTEPEAADAIRRDAPRPS